jgi:hypothetical protein
MLARASGHRLQSAARPRTASTHDTYIHRPKRALKKKSKATAIAGPTIISTTSKPDRGRRPDMTGDVTEASPEVKAFFARMMRPPGS